MHTRSDDPQVLQEFAASLGTRDPKTVATYQTTVRDFVAWLAPQPGGTPFHIGLVTETAVRGYIRVSGDVLAYGSTHVFLSMKLANPFFRSAIGHSLHLFGVLSPLHGDL